MTLNIFQKGFNFSQDGPGNRLVYHLQGCNLRCPWCSNPEGLACSGGEARTLEELMDEVRRSSVMFFDGGGVTLTGGEVTLQFEPVKEFLTGLHRAGYSTCIETNGTSPRLPELFPVLDLLIADIKHYDEVKHRAVTGGSCAQTFLNVKAALDYALPTALRIPLIGGFNASPEDAEGFVSLFTSLGVGQRATIELLPYHEYGKSKYSSLGLAYTVGEEARISGDTLKTFSRILSESGLTIIKT